MIVQDSTFYYLYGVIKAVSKLCAEEDKTLDTVLNDIIDIFDKVIKDNESQNEKELDDKVIKAARKILNENKENH